MQFLVCFSAFALSTAARAQVGVTYDEGPVTAVTYLKDAMAVEMIGSAADQDKARVERSAYRKNLGSELIREMILK